MKNFLAFTMCGVCLFIFGATLGEPTFDHAIHEEQELACEECHLPPPSSPHWEAAMPDRQICLDCHDEEDLPATAAQPTSHIADYRHEHQFDGRATGGDCALCHRNSEKCSICHHGENVDFLVHDRNWRFTHALTRFKGTEDCAACHNTRSFCQDCHLQNGIKPGNHFVAGWTTIHAEEARLDLTTCIQCHGGPEPVCKDCHD